MTIWDILSSVMRRWYIILASIAVGLAASHAVIGAAGVYWSRAEVTFLAPASDVNPNALTTRSSDLIVTAGVVAKLVNGNITWNKLADPSATLVGEGVYDGWAVRLPDYGGQWSSVYSRAVLDVQVTGPDAETVRERQSALLVQIDQHLDELQEGVAPTDRITTTVVPAEPTVYYVSGRTTRALAMVWMLCGAAALATASLLETSKRRKQHVRAAADQGNERVESNRDEILAATSQTSPASSSARLAPTTG